MEEVPDAYQSMQSFRVTKAIQADFRSLIYFPPSMTRKVAAAVGYGILSHAMIDYPAIASWLEYEWKQPKVSRVLEYLPQLVQEDGRLSTNPDFWRSLSVYITATTQELCHQHGLPVSQTDLSFASTDLPLRLLCNHFNIALILLRGNAEELTQEIVWNRKNIGLVVILAEEKNGVLFLNHKRMWEDEGEKRTGFPYFLQPNDELPRFPGFTNKFEQYKRLIDIACRLIEATSTFAMEINPSAADYPSKLLSELKNYRQSLDYSSVERRKNAAESRQIHDITQCPQYPGHLYQLPDCGHNFHIPCLRSHIDASQAAMCPVCYTSISASAMEVIYQQVSVQTHSSESQCQKCGRLAENWQLLQHSYGAENSHYVCVRCLSSQANCPYCYLPLSPQELAWTTEVTSLLPQQSV